MHSQPLLVVTAVLLGQAAAQLHTVTAQCTPEPDCNKNNVGVACKVTCIDNPGGTRVTTGFCKSGVFGVSCTP
ncbi:hypothetical protein BDP81DRAFT_390220 [Colletotrichum phormii]|uniref:Uncharacterized protein n=1 Tax=Colletotrichum phormii TaxID=359342 RepID=A0AAJ0ELB4_9PEZI|nr:uncharacterized protein BDP81DRAFT_390220 [Colletotrichum phormii]KAK1640886.1 hypothetical protein BDP81DRAFT_390220 [Colletotrichum phormii]